MSSNLAQISLILKKKPDVSDQASRNSPRTQYTLNDFSEYRMDINLAQNKRLTNGRSVSTEQSLLVRKR